MTTAISTRYYDEIDTITIKKTRNPDPRNLQHLSRTLQLMAAVVHNEETQIVLKTIRSASTSAFIRSPSNTLPLRIAMDNGFSMYCWITRFSGRAP